MVSSFNIYFSRKQSTAHIHTTHVTRTQTRYAGKLLIYIYCDILYVVLQTLRRTHSRWTMVIHRANTSNPDLYTITYARDGDLSASKYNLFAILLSIKTLAINISGWDRLIAISQFTLLLYTKHTTAHCILITLLRKKRVLSSR